MGKVDYVEGQNDDVVVDEYEYEYEFEFEFEYE